MRRTAPYGLVQSPDWCLPSLNHELCGSVSCTESISVAGPILHSLKGSRTLGGAPGRRRSERAEADKTVPLLHQTSHVEAANFKHVNFLYETCVKKGNQTPQRHSTATSEVTEEVEKLLTLHADSSNGASENHDLDERGHADLTKIRTEQDAVAFFARHGSTTKTKFLFCNRHPAHPLEFEPYKLIVVPQNQVNPEHFTISPTAVMHICPGKPSECIRQDEWMRQAFVHSVLRSLPFFKSFAAKKVLSLWSHASRRHMFEQRREMLCRTLFLAKPIYCDHLTQIHDVLAGVSSVKLVELQPILYDSSQFISQQHALRSDPKAGTGKELEAVTGAASTVLERVGTEETCTKLFLVNVSFGATQVEFNPGRTDFVTMLQDMWEASCTTHDDLSSEMELMSEFEEKLDKLNPVHVVGLFSIEARGLKSSLQPITDKALSFMKRRLWKLMKDHVRATASKFEAINRQLDERPTKLIPFVAFLKSCNDIKSQLEDLDRDKATAEDMFALLKQYGVRLAVEDSIQLENLLNSASDFERFKLLDAAEHIRRNIDAMRAELKAKTEEVEREMEELSKLIVDEEAPKCFEKLKDYQNRIDFAYGKAETLRGMRELLIPDSSGVLSKQAEATFNAIKPKVAMWENICLWQADTAKWLGVPLVSLHAEEVEQGLTRYLKEACVAVQAFPEDPVALEFKKEVEKWRSRLPLILDLGNPALKRHHWASILEELKITGTEESVCLRQLDQKEALQKRDFINEISTLASVQQSLSQTLEKTVKAWENRELLIKPFEDDNNAFIIRDLSDLLSMLEDHQISMQRMLHNPYVGSLKETVEVWAGRLDLAQQVVEELAELQRHWIGLQSIFSNAEALEQIPDESEAFEQADDFWRAYLRRIRGEQSNILTVVEEEGLLDILAENNKILAGVQRKLEEYVDTKRSAFPRFYFLSNEELLKVISKAKQPAVLQESLRKCFGGLHGVTLAANGTTIEGVYSSNGETIGLLSPVNCLSPVEEWFAELERAVSASLRHYLKTALEARVANEDEENIGTWLLEHPAQCAMTATMINWCTRAEAALTSVELKGDLASLSQCVNDCNREIEQFRYRHEYLGCGTRLVVTPLTAKCFMTLTSALHLGYGGAPAGPAGSGKTETVKDLAKALGVPCIVFNCSSELDHQMMSRLFSGLAQSGAWGCFDEFNRIDIEVLSVVAQQLLRIQTAIRGKKTMVDFDGKSLLLDSRVGVFITNNPSYAGRTELPGNLRSLFRPVSMVVPDFTQICEVLLFASGFLHAKTLAKKVVQVFSTSATLLSQQSHYDWGLRAMKTVLLIAGSAKERQQKVSEEDLVIQALHGVVPRLISDDVPIFSGIVAETFPQQCVNLAKDNSTKTAIEEMLQQQRLQAPPSFVEKALQLYETQLIRHGILLVGAPGVGKTTLLSCLSGVISRIQQTHESAPQAQDHAEDRIEGEPACEVLRVNPKALQESALFGRMDPSSKEWLDGIVSAHIREAVASSRDSPLWIVLDGPLDPIWAEDLNSALDDNKTLCLSNGERINLPSALKIFFEVADLGAASPATVSRCGTVYIEPGHLGYLPILCSWRQNFEVQKSKFARLAGQIEGWCAKIIQKALPHIRNACTEMCKQLNDLDSASLYNLIVDEQSLSFKTFDSMLEERKDEENGIDFDKFFVPTRATVAHRHIIDSLVQTIKHIFNHLLNQSWQSTLPSLCHCAADVIEATVNSYEQIKAHLLPTPLKCHYNFNLRDVAKATEAMLMADPSKITSEVDIAR
ncbi:hypothetical protein Emed_005361 [Eimeria media]